RLLVSWFFLQILPAAYFAVAIASVRGRRIPLDHLGVLFLWACALSFSALAIPAFYRYWLAFVIWMRWHPTTLSNGREDVEVTRQFDFGAGNFVSWGTVTFVAAIVGLAVFRCASRAPGWPAMTP